MDQLNNTRLLRRALLADAVMSAAAGLVMGIGAPWLNDLLQLPEPLLRGAGLFLMPYAALVALVGTRRKPLLPAAWAIIGANVIWAVDSVALLGSGRVAPNALGTAFVLAQAGAVAIFAALQYAGVRRRRAPLIESAG